MYYANKVIRESKLLTLINGLVSLILQKTIKEFN